MRAAVEEQPDFSAWVPSTPETDTTLHGKVDLVLANQGVIEGKVDQAIEIGNKTLQNTEEIKANLHKLANLICKVASESVPRLALLLPPQPGNNSTPEEDQSFFEQAVDLWDAVVTAVEDEWDDIFYDKAELMFLCEGPMVLGTKSCSEIKKLEIKQFKKWVQALAPVIKLAGLMLNLASKLCTGLALFESIGISSNQTQLMAEFYQGKFTDQIADYEALGEEFLTEHEQLSEEKLTLICEQATKLTGEAYRQVAQLCETYQFDHGLVLTKTPDKVEACWLCDQCCASLPGGAQAEGAPAEAHEAAAEESSPVKDIAASSGAQPKSTLGGTEGAEEALAEDPPPCSCSCRVM